MLPWKCDWLLVGIIKGQVLGMCLQGIHLSGADHRWCQLFKGIHPSIAMFIHCPTNGQVAHYLLTQEQLSGFGFGDGQLYVSPFTSPVDPAVFVLPVQEELTKAEIIPIPGILTALVEDPRALVRIGFATRVDIKTDRTPVLEQSGPLTYVQRYLP